jgi:DNA-binding beta-propeller fold protein YncE
MRFTSVFLLLFLLQTFAYCQKESLHLSDISKISTAVIKLNGYPDFFAVDSNDVWITNTKKIEKLSADSSKPVLTVEVPEPCGAPIVGFGSLWVANCSDKSIYRIDRNTGQILAKIPTGLASKIGELSLAIGAGSVWVLSDSSGVLTRINPLKNNIQKRIKVKPLSYCVAFGYDAVWVTNTGHVKYKWKTGEAIATKRGSIQRIDPMTNKVKATIDVGLAPLFLAAGENGIWTLNQGDGTVSRIDPHTNKLKATIDVKASGGGGDIATGAGKVWIRGNLTAFLLSVDPGSNSVDKQYGPISGSGAVRVTKNNIIWVSAHDINTVWLIKQ